MKKVSKDMIIGEALQIDNGVIPILMRSGLHCLGCPSAQRETIEEAAEVHGIDVDGLIDEINIYLETV